MTGDDLGFTIVFPTPTATRLTKSSNVTAEGTVSALTKLANTEADRSTPSAAAITRQNFRSLSVGSISINIQGVPGVEAPRRPRFGPRDPAIVYPPFRAPRTRTSGSKAS